MKWTFTRTIVYGRSADKADIAVRVVNDCFSNTEPAMKSTIGGNQTSAAVEYFALLQRRWVYFELSRERL
jgi:hypothetical protein